MVEAGSLHLEMQQAREGGVWPAPSSLAKPQQVTALSLVGLSLGSAECLRRDGERKASPCSAPRGTPSNVSPRSTASAASIWPYLAECCQPNLLWAGLPIHPPCPALSHLLGSCLGGKVSPQTAWGQLWGLVPWSTLPGLCPVPPHFSGVGRLVTSSSRIIIAFGARKLTSNRGRGGGSVPFCTLKGSGSIPGRQCRREKKQPVGCCQSVLTILSKRDERPDSESSFL